MFSPDYIYHIIALLIGLTIHEFAHAWTANYLGDPTPRLAGRLSLNPLVHLDPLGTLMILFGPIGWAKPVPVNPYTLKHPRFGDMLISIAGPLSNFLLALICSIPLKYLPLDSILVPLLWNIVLLNIGLMIFNFFPIYPLDGSHVIASIIPARYRASFDEYLKIGPFILLIIIILENTSNIHILSTIIFGVAQKILILFGLMS